MPSVPFEAKRLARATCIFSRDELLSGHSALRDYGFAVPTELESPQDYTQQSACFDAERYGGIGVGANGGAGRSGSRGRFQIKGIGRTPLIAATAEVGDFWHSHGGMSLIDAIQEVAWSEILQVVLPHGAVRTAALLSTGTRCWYEGDGGERTTTPRATVVRETAARPAHFMRAPFFRPKAVVELSSDVARVKQATEQLPTLLPNMFISSAAPDVELISLGLINTATRFAQQCAAAQSKRLMHGALNASNIALDGRWLDFGTATALPTFANTKSCGASRHFATLWEEHSRMERVLEELCFSVNKYSPAFVKGGGISAASLLQHYRSAYTAALRGAALDLLGVPRELLRSTVAEPADRLGSALVEVMKLGHERRVESAVPDLAVHGKNIVGAVIRDLARGFEAAAVAEPSAALVPTAGLRTRLAAAFSDFSRAMCAEPSATGLSRQSLGRLYLLGGLKSSREMPNLYRRNMAADNRRIVQGCSEPDAIAHAVKCKLLRLVDTAVMLHSPARHDSVAVWRGQGLAIDYHVRKAMFSGGHTDAARRFAPSLGGLVDLGELVAYYGEDCALLR